MSSSNDDNSGSGNRPSSQDQQQGKKQPHESRNLTFRPAIDKPDELMAFLREVADRYNAQRCSLLVVQEKSAEAEPTSCSALCAAPSVQVSSPRKRSSTSNSGKKRRSSPASASPASAPAKAKATKAYASSDMPESACIPTTATRTGSTTGRRRRRRNHASLVGAKNINIHAPDPEEDSPPDETSSERRKRRERINGRRKRAKLMIEIDTLNTRYHELKQNNTKLSDENASLRTRIAELKRGLTDQRPVVPAPAAGPEPDTKKPPAKRKKSLSLGAQQQQQQESKRGEIIGPTIGANANTSHSNRNSDTQASVRTSNPSLSMQSDFQSALNASIAFPSSFQQPFLTAPGQLQYPQAIPNPGNLQQTLVSMLSNQQEHSSRFQQPQQMHHWLPFLGLGQGGEQQRNATNSNSTDTTQNGTQQGHAFSQQDQHGQQHPRHPPRRGR